MYLSGSKRKLRGPRIEMVTLSMRQLAAAQRRRDQRDSQRQQSRKRAVSLLQEGRTVSAVVQLSGVSNGTVMRLRKALDNPESLHKLLDPASNRAGKSSVLSKTEELRKN